MKLYHLLIPIALFSIWYAYEFHLPRPTFSGQASVIDGDTITIDNKKVRFHAYDAPEALQTCVNAKGDEYACGSISTQKLKEIINGKNVICSQRKTDQYDRVVATCSVDGKDIGWDMVQSGNAVAYFYYSWRLAPAHIEAMLKNKGIWAGSCTNPYQWRKSHRYQCKLC